MKIIAFNVVVSSVGIRELYLELLFVLAKLSSVLIFVFCLLRDNFQSLTFLRDVRTFLSNLYLWFPYGLTVKSAYFQHEPSKNFDDVYYIGEKSPTADFVHKFSHLCLPLIGVEWRIKTSSDFGS
uniref:Uncharacterized protein n=1 Tax=Glossina brevipalpis TaxID=37001 RepID=A0A1A9W6L2_9MUSC